MEALAATSMDDDAGVESRWTSNALQRSENVKLEKLFNDSTRDAHLFKETAIAAMALMEWCQRAAEQNMSIAPSRARSRKSARAQANAMIIDFNESEFTELKDIVDNLELSWQKKHSTSYKRLTTVCKTLHAHKEIFSVFPSQNIYASVLCGTLCIFVEAVINHDSIADTLSKTVEEISTKTACCANLVKVITTQSMKAKLAEVYTKGFDHYSDVMEWYLKSRIRRFFGSFNEEIKKKSEASAKVIDTLIQQMYREAEIGGHAMSRTLLNHVSWTEQFLEQEMGSIKSGLKDVRSELSRQHKPHLSKSLSSEAVREPAFQSLLSTFDELIVDQPDTKFIFRKTASENQPRSESMIRGVGYVDSTREISSTNITDGSLNEVILGLERNIYGHDGSRILKWPGPTRLGDRARVKLHSMLKSIPGAQVLWLQGPFGYQQMTVAKEVSLSVIQAASKSEVPFIAHFCERERNLESEPPDGRGRMVIGLVYNLIKQLVQFQHSLDTDLRDKLSKLDGTYATWSCSISILSELFQSITSLEYCVIHGFNILEIEDDLARCQDLLVVLLENKKLERRGFKLLLTTSGQSRLLAEKIPPQNRYKMSQNFTLVGG